MQQRLEARILRSDGVYVDKCFRPGDCVGIVVNNNKILSYIKKGDLLYTLRECYYWETTDYRNMRNPVVPGTVCIYLGPATMYQGMELMVYESHNWLAGNVARTMDFNTNDFAVLWSFETLREFCSKTKTGLSSLILAPDLASIVACNNSNE